MKYYKQILGASMVVALAFVVGVNVPASAQTMTVTASPVFVRDLTIGATGSDVLALQKFLNAKGFVVASTGAGSPGSESTYFGALTRSAVARYQAANGIVPAVGYFGPVTRAHVNVNYQTPTTPTNPGNDNDDDLNGGDGDFRDFDLLGDPSGEDVEEGEEVSVLGFEFEADDSDLRLERLDIELGSDTDDRPWRYIESITLYDGEDDEIASIDASDEDEWDEIGSSDVYEATFSDIDTVVEEGDTAEFYIKVEAMSSIDDSDLPIEWTIAIPRDGLRALNAEGINVYEGDVEESFTLEAAEAGEFDISVDDDENDDMVVEVDEDNDTDDVVLYTATIESDQGDNLLEELSFTIESSTSTITKIVKTFYLEIDGDEVASESSTGANSDSATITFDDIDYEIDEDEEVEVRIIATVRDTNEGGNYDSGDTLQVTGMTVDYVDDNDDDLTETETTDGGVITLSTDSINVSGPSSTSADHVGSDESRGRYVIKFDVTAPEDEDIYIDLDSATDVFSIINAATGATTTTGVTSATLSGGTVTGGKIRINEGQSKTLTLTVNLNNSGEAERSLRVGLTELYYRVGSAGATEEVYTSGLDEDYETEDLLLLTANID